METPGQNGHANGEGNGRVRQRKAVIVGAGPVGCLAAIALANRGWTVDVYEGRAGAGSFSSDSGRGSEEGQRSINLVLSSRGLAALYAINPFLASRLMEHTIPIHSRMIHMKDGGSTSLQYDPHKQASPFFCPSKIKYPPAYAHRPFDLSPEQTINSISRELLNRKLVQEALLVPNIRFFFQHKPQSVDFHRNLLTVRDVLADTTTQVPFDLCVGADGSHSFVRRQIMRVTR